MKFYLFLCCIALMSCNEAPSTGFTTYPTTGTIERIDPALDAILDTAAKAEIIAEGFDWSEGPLWVESEKMLLFSDVPRNIVYKWTEEKGTEIYLQPSGYTDTTTSQSKEPGSNGLLLDPAGSLVLCQHGNRQMAKMDAPLSQPTPSFISLAGTYQGKRFSSPNDAAYNSAGELFFTDPPYGLPQQNDEDPLKEIPFNGVYKLKQNGEVVLLVDSITRPNGIALFPGEQQLLIASSDGRNPNWYSYDIDGDLLKNGRLFYPAISDAKGERGSPDGLTIDRQGIVFATGPGGIWIFDRHAKLLGKIKLEQAASNVVLSADEKTIYITNDALIVRVKLRK